MVCQPADEKFEFSESWPWAIDRDRPLEQRGGVSGSLCTAYIIIRLTSMLYPDRADVIGALLASKVSAQGILTNLGLRPVIWQENSIQFHAHVAAGAPCSSASLGDRGKAKAQNVRKLC